MGYFISQVFLSGKHGCAATCKIIYLSINIHSSLPQGERVPSFHQVLMVAIAQIINFSFLKTGSRAREIAQW